MAYQTSYYLESRKDKKTGKIIVKNVPIRFCFAFDGQKFMSNTGIKADEIQWSKTKQQFKSGSSNSEAKNTQLKAIAEKLEAIYLKIKNSGVEVTKEEISEIWQAKGIMKDFYSYFDEFTRVEGQNKAWSHATYQKFKTLKIHLKTFEQSESIKMEFQKINKDFYQKLFDFFVKKGHRNSSIKKTFMNINWFLGWCIENKNITIKDFKKFTIKESKSAAGNPLNIVFLKPEEFLMMFEANIPDLRLSRIKDIFCFMCACGLRYSDMAALRREDVTEDSIKITTQKTADALEIPLNHFSKSILTKYDGILPKISNVRLNLYLKELAKYLELNRRLTKVYIKAGTTVKEEAELWQVLTSHCARKTFISLSVFLNMNPEIIMRFSGHHSHKMMEVYTGITDKQKQAQMALFTAENIRDKIAN